jgi:Spy/CpxP family protein refolding chaperone
MVGGRVSARNSLVSKSVKVAHFCCCLKNTEIEEKICMKKPFRGILFAWFFLVGLWSSPVLGQDLQALESLVAGASGGDGPGSLLPLLLKGVGLNDEQNERVKEIIGAHRKTLRKLFKQLRAANEELANKLFVPEDVQETDLAPQIQQITQLREQLLREGLKAVLEVRQVLTPEQRAKAARLKEHIQALQAAMSGIIQEQETGITSEKETGKPTEEEATPSEAR